MIFKLFLLISFEMNELNIVVVVIVCTVIFVIVVVIVMYVSFSYAFMAVSLEFLCLI